MFHLQMDRILNHDLAFKINKPTKPCLPLTGRKTDEYQKESHTQWLRLKDIFGDDLIPLPSQTEELG